MLLKAQFESPVCETRARVELIHLGQKKGENASAYMARTKTLLHKVPGYDLKTALQQWVLGLRQPYRLEVAKASPQTLAEAERLVVRLKTPWNLPVLARTKVERARRLEAIKRKKKRTKMQGNLAGQRELYNSKGNAKREASFSRGIKRIFRLHQADKGQLGSHRDPRNSRAPKTTRTSKCWRVWPEGSRKDQPETTKSGRHGQR